MIATAKKSLTLAALLASTSVLAATPDWRISEVSGGVTVERSGKVLTARQDTTLLPGDVIRTGQKGRAVLVRGKEFVVVSPDAQLKVAVPEETGPVTQFFQYLGNALFKIEKKSTPHFGVKTPYLAAVVKGTTFNVSVGADRSSVQVTEGAVEVATGDDLEAALITPGLIGFVDADDAGELLIISGNRSGEDLSGAIVRGTPEFVNTPPQARSNRDDRVGLPGASGLTPAAVRANSVLNANPALATTGQQISLGLMDDDVSGGEQQSASFNVESPTDLGEPDALFTQETAINDAGDNTQSAASREESEAENDPVADDESVDDSDSSDTAEINLGDGNNGHGNDDGFDESNPGQGDANSDGTDGGDDETDDDGAVGLAFGPGDGFNQRFGNSNAGGNGNGNGNGNSDGDRDSDTDVGADLDLDDGNNGHGNDDDGVDASNPGKGQRNGNSAGDEDEDGSEDDGDIDVDDDLDLDLDDDGDDGNNGHGNDDDGDDDSNPGKGKGKGRGHGHGHGHGHGKGGGKGN